MSVRIYVYAQNIHEPGQDLSIHMSTHMSTHMCVHMCMHMSMPTRLRTHVYVHACACGGPAAIRSMDMGHNYVCHDYTGHSYIGHNYIGTCVRRTGGTAIRSMG